MSFCQPQQINGNITYGDSFGDDYRGLFILLNHGDSVIQAARPDSTGEFVFKNVNRGFYNVVIKQIGRKDFIADSLLIVADKPVHLAMIYPPPCMLVYLKGHKPICPRDHSDKIIPIVYGFPRNKTMEKAKKGLVRLGGCLVSDCDPRYYCTIHKIEF